MVPPGAVPDPTPVVAVEPVCPKVPMLPLAPTVPEGDVVVDPVVPTVLFSVPAPALFELMEPVAVEFPVCPRPAPMLPVFVVPAVPVAPAVPAPVVPAPVCAAAKAVQSASVAVIRSFRIDSPLRILVRIDGDPGRVYAPPPQLMYALFNGMTAGRHGSTRRGSHSQVHPRRVSPDNQRCRIAIDSYMAEKSMPGEATPAQAENPEVAEPRNFNFNLETEMQRARELPLTGGRASHALISYPNLKQLIIYMPAGSRWDEHSTPGRISVQVLRGEIRMSALGNSRNLAAGEIATFDANVKHNVEALSESWYLLTVARCP